MDFLELKYLLGTVRNLFVDTMPDEGLRKLGEKMAQEVTNCFLGSRDPYGHPWAPLKSRQGLPLVKTGTLMEAAVDAASRPRITSDGVITIDLTSPGYAAYQNFGTMHVPAREYYGMNEAIQKALAETVGENIVEFLINGRKS